MAFIISTDDCLGCGVCAQECPNCAIRMEDDVAVIDADLCIDCGTCLDLCPVQAPRPN